MEPIPAAKTGELLPGNADLTELAAQLPPDRRGSSFEVAAMVAVTATLVIVALIITPKFAQIFKELGVQLPRRTEDVLQVWFHLVALAVLVAPCIWRYRAGSQSWATVVWFVLCLFYMVVVVLGLFAPLMTLTDGGLGSELGPERSSP